MNLSIPNINISDGSNKEIVDVLHRYRKELNFLLMNLDESNMPSIAGRLDGLDGSFSLIDQQLDQITLAVGNAAGDISTLQLRADGIDLAVSNLTGDFSSLSLTVDGIQSTVSNQAGQISTISQTVNAISSTVYDSVDGLGAAWSAINQNAYEIDLKVGATYVDGAIDDLDDYLTGNQLITRINLTSTTATIQASKINLKGITTIYDDGSDSNYARFDNGYFYLTQNNVKFFSAERNILGYTLINGNSVSYNPVYFAGKVIFADEVTFMYPPTAVYA